MTKMETGDNDGAKKDFEICVKLDPETGELKRFLGMAKLNLKDKKGACSKFEKAKKLGDFQVEELIQSNCK